MNPYKEERFTFLIDDLLSSIRQEDEDEEMNIYRELKFRFKLTIFLSSILFLDLEIE